MHVMSGLIKRSATVGILTLSMTTLGLAAGAAAAQNPPAAGGQGRGTPPPPQNLQVLPKDIPRAELTRTMQLWAQALGVQCSHCHVTEPSRDFASDAKAPKKVARTMLQMVNHNNDMLRTGIGKAAADVVQVQCWTCHRGAVTPTAPPPLPPPAAPGGAAAAPAPGR
jgi:hypothetical protein